MHPGKICVPEGKEGNLREKSVAACRKGAKAGAFAGKNFMQNIYCQPWENPL